MSGAGLAEKNYAAWSYENVLQFYASQRHRAEELYDSERAVMLPALESCGSVLDVGCAAGGFYQIFKSLKPGISYTGLDVVPEMVEVARRRHPEGRFEVSDAGSLNFADRSFDMSFCTGVLLHNPNFTQAIHELYRVARKACIIDLPRLVAVPYAFDKKTSYMVLKRRFHDVETSASEEKTTVPYVLANPQPVFEFLLEGLRPKPHTLVAVGYYGHPNESVVLPVKPICFCVVYLGVGDGRVKNTRVLLDVPEDIRAQIKLKHAEFIDGGRGAIASLISGN